MNPWKLIGWIVLAILVLFLYACFRALGGMAESDGPSNVTRSTPTAAPTYHLEVVSIECQDNHGRNRADITARNDGSSPIPYAKVFVEFKDKSGKVLSAQDSYFQPTTIPVGATASATVYSSGGGAETCGPTRIQDGDGNAVTISAK